MSVFIWKNILSIDNYKIKININHANHWNHVLNSKYSGKIYLYKSKQAH